MRSLSRTSAMRPSISAWPPLRRSASTIGVQRDLGMLDHEQPRGAERHDAVADFRADRAAAAGDDDRLAAHDVFKAVIVDRHARPQQQVFDRHRGKLHGLAAIGERRQAAGLQPEPARPHQGRFRRRLRHQRGRREDQPPDMRAARLAVADHLFEIVEAADHRNAAHRLAAVGKRRRQDADRAHAADRAALDCAQQHLGIGRAPEHERRHRMLAAHMLLRAHIAELAVGDARSRQERHLQEPVEDDGDLAEEVRAVDLRRHQDVVEHQQREREHGRGADDVEQVGQRGEAPLRGVQPEEKIDEARIDEEAGQEPDEPVEAFRQPRVLEADEEARHDRHGRREQVMRDDQILARREREDLAHQGAAGGWIMAPQ